GIRAGHVTGVQTCALPICVVAEFLDEIGFPRDRTADWEADLVQKFRNDASVKEIVSERESSLGRSLYIAKPIQISNAACLQCHKDPKSVGQGKWVSPRRSQ